MIYQINNSQDWKS